MCIRDRSNGPRKKLPINTQSDFQAQVPKAAGSMEDAKYKTRVNRLRASIE